MTEVLKRDDPRIRGCYIFDGPEYSYARLPTGYMFLVERPKKPCVSCGELISTMEDNQYVDEDGNVTDEVICPDCDDLLMACRLGL